MNNGTAPTGGGGAPTIAVATTTTTPAPRLKDHTLESLKLEHQLVKVIVSIGLHKGLVDVSFLLLLNFAWFLSETLLLLVSIPGLEP